MENKVLLEVKNLKKYFNTPKGLLHAVDDINFTICEGKTLGVVGESGCGKSTFLRSINRMNDLIPNVKYEGNIIFDGKNIFDKEYDIVELRKKIGMVFQKPNPFPKSIYENLVYAPKLHGEKDKDKGKEKRFYHTFVYLL